MQRYSTTTPYNYTILATITPSANNKYDSTSINLQMHKITFWKLAKPHLGLYHFYAKDD